MLDGARLERVVQALRRAVLARDCAAESEASERACGEERERLRSRTLRASARVLAASAPPLLVVAAPGAALRASLVLLSDEILAFPKETCAKLTMPLPSPTVVP